MQVWDSQYVNCSTVDCTIDSVDEYEVGLAPLFITFWNACNNVEDEMHLVLFVMECPCQAPRHRYYCLYALYSTGRNRVAQGSQVLCLVSLRKGERLRPLYMSFSSQ